MKGNKIPKSKEMEESKEKGKKKCGKSDKNMQRNKKIGV